VDFSARPLSNEQVRHAATSALIINSVALPVVVILAIYHAEPVRWGYLVAADVCVVAPFVYMVSNLMVRRRQVSVEPKPALLFVTVALGLLALAFVEVASGTEVGYFRPAFVLGVILTGILGDDRMRIAIIAWSVALVAWTTWAEGIGGGQLVAVVVIYAWVFVVTTWVIARTFHSLRTLGTSREGLRRMAEALATTENLEQAFDIALPMIPQVLPTDRVSVLLDLGDGPHEFVAWPRHDAGADVLPNVAAYRMALEHDACTYANDCCFIPIGHADNGGRLAIAVHHRRHPHETDVDVIETGEQIAATFLKLTSRIAYVSELQRQTRTDALTGLANRRGLVERLDDELARARRRDLPLTIAMVDLDGFKRHNDANGHLAGDVLLRAYAELLTSNLRAQDLAARYGGDEFCIVLPETDEHGVMELFARLRESVQRSPSTRGVMFSMGVSQWDRSEGAEGLLERADEALYEAKQAGRDRVIAAHR
jgi:diguanylate cyclase (GGDEF)-like protein